MSKGLSAAELRRTGRVRGLGQEIEMVRARLAKRVQTGRATDRFVHEQATLLARLVVAQCRAMGIEADASMEHVVAKRAPVALADLLTTSARIGRQKENMPDTTQTPKHEENVEREREDMVAQATMSPDVLDLMRLYEGAERVYASTAPEPKIWIIPSTTNGSGRVQTWARQAVRSGLPKTGQRRHARGRARQIG